MSELPQRIAAARHRIRVDVTPDEIADGLTALHARARWRRRVRRGAGAALLVAVVGVSMATAVHLVGQGAQILQVVAVAGLLGVVVQEPLAQVADAGRGSFGHRVLLSGLCNASKIRSDCCDYGLPGIPPARNGKPPIRPAGILKGQFAVIIVSK